MAGDVFKKRAQRSIKEKSGLPTIPEEPDPVKVMYQKVLHEMQNNNTKFNRLMLRMNYDGFMNKMEKEGKTNCLGITGVKNVHSKKKLSTGAHWTDREIKVFVENLYCVLQTLLLLLVLTCLVLYLMTTKPVPLQQYLKTASTLVNENIFLTTLVIIYYACQYTPPIAREK